MRHRSVGFGTTATTTGAVVAVVCFSFLFFHTTLPFVEGRATIVKVNDPYPYHPCALCNDTGTRLTNCRCVGDYPRYVYPPPFDYSLCPAKASYPLYVLQESTYQWVFTPNEGITFIVFDPESGVNGTFSCATIDQSNLCGGPLSIDSQSISSTIQFRWSDASYATLDYDLSCQSGFESPDAPSPDRSATVTCSVNPSWSSIDVNTQVWVMYRYQMYYDDRIVVSRTNPIECRPIPTLRSPGLAAVLITVTLITTMVGMYLGCFRGMRKPSDGNANDLRCGRAPAIPVFMESYESGQHSLKTSIPAFLLLSTAALLQLISLSMDEWLSTGWAGGRTYAGLFEVFADLRDPLPSNNSPYPYPYYSQTAVYAEAPSHTLCRTCTHPIACVVCVVMCVRIVCQSLISVFLAMDISIRIVTAFSIEPHRPARIVGSI